MFPAQINPWGLLRLFCCSSKMQESVSSPGAVTTKTYLLLGSSGLQWRSRCHSLVYLCRTHLTFDQFMPQAGFGPSKFVIAPSLERASACFLASNPLCPDIHHGVATRLWQASTVSSGSISTLIWKWWHRLIPMPFLIQHTLIIVSQKILFNKTLIQLIIIYNFLPDKISLPQK